VTYDVCDQLRKSDTSGIALLVKSIHLLIQQCFRSEDALLSGIEQIAQAGGLALLTSSDGITIKAGPYITWCHRLHEEDLAVLVRLMENNKHLGWEDGYVKRVMTNFSESCERLQSCRVEITATDGSGVIGFLFSSLNNEVVDIWGTFELLFMRQPCVTRALLAIAK
jgi:hypothetical protein